VKITDAIHEFVLYKQSLGMSYSRGYTAVLYNRAARCHRKNLPSHTLSPPTRSSTPASQGYPPSCVCRTSLELANSI
jgi:hypothetical protein